MMRDYIRKMLNDGIDKVYNNLIDRAYEEGQLDAYLEFTKPHHEEKLENEASARTEGWQTGYDVGYRVGRSAGKVAVGFVGTRDELKNDDPRPVPIARYIDGERVTENAWQRHEANKYGAWE